eukprot:928996-Rhodomonas_salina.1
MEHFQPGKASGVHSSPNDLLERTRMPSLSQMLADAGSASSQQFSNLLPAQGTLTQAQQPRVEQRFNTSGTIQATLGGERKNLDGDGGVGGMQQQHHSYDNFASLGSSPATSQPSNLSHLLSTLSNSKQQPADQQMTNAQVMAVLQRGERLLAPAAKAASTPGNNPSMESSRVVGFAGGSGSAVGTIGRGGGGGIGVGGGGGTGGGNSGVESSTAGSLVGGRGGFGYSTAGGGANNTTTVAALPGWRDVGGGGGGGG